MVVAVAVSMSVMEYNNYGAYNAAYQPYTSYSSYTQQPSHFNLKVGLRTVCDRSASCVDIYSHYLFLSSLCAIVLLVFRLV